MKSKEVRVCQKCGSINIRSSFWPAKMAEFLSQNPKIVKRYQDLFGCNDCDHIGIFPLVPVSELESYRKTIKQKK